MERGMLLEVGPPEQLYARPKSLYVASFLGGGTVLGGRVANGSACFGSMSLPIPADVPHEEGASVELLFRPEQVSLSAEKPGTDLPVLGRGQVFEQTFSGAMRRLRLSLPRLAGTRQIAPAVGFGEDRFTIETIVPADYLVPAEELWVTLRGWTILQQAPSLLVILFGSGPLLPEAARTVANSMRASVTVLSLAPEDSPANVSEIIADQAREVGLTDFEVHTSSGNLSQQISAQSANTLYELVILPRNLADSHARLSKDVVAFLARADIPVLVIAEEAKPRVSRILICTAAGEPGKSDIRIGGRLARHVGATVTLLHVTRRNGEVRPLVHRHLKQASSTLSTGG
jgi:hypothetical protein